MAVGQVAKNPDADDENNGHGTSGNEVNPSTPSVSEKELDGLLSLGKLCKSAGKIEIARKKLEEIIKAAPSSPQAKEAAELLLKLN